MRDISSLPRKQLAFLPTPVHELPRLTKVLKGPRILMKRDDQTGLALGGNKVRKLEFLVGDALAKNCDTLITAGALQSNHCRQTAAAAAACGLSCHLVLGGQAPAIAQGNILLDRLFNATITWSGELRKGELIPALKTQLQSQGRTPYDIPYGGSNAIGALGYAHAFRELMQQMKQLSIDLDSIVFASSSGGTHAGLLVGAAECGYQGTIRGVKIDKESIGSLPFRTTVTQIAASAATMMNIPFHPTAADVILNEQFCNAGYGTITSVEKDAIRMVAEYEGIVLDPVYTGRAMAGLIALIRDGCYSTSQTVLFLHTGGAPALFAYAQELVG
ncbi:MAG: D-cysteine desulfhydrase family protein [Chitinivibrionales bacterium]|nr:D-cysteine desulfhydrase family protein [Chitinivibrionales bacterium]